MIVCYIQQYNARNNMNTDAELIRVIHNTLDWLQSEQMKLPDGAEPLFFAIPGV